MSIQVTIDGLDYDVDVTLIDSPSDIDPETYMALRGLKGDTGNSGSDGANGVGITSITQNLDGTLTITLDDGTSYDTDPVKGEKGDTGDTGNGIASVVKTATSGLVDTYTITYTDGTTATFDITNGKDGQDGQDGHSPSVTASKVGDTTTIYVDGTAIGTIDDGVDGQNGQNGQDGHSPVVTASKSGKVTTVYVDGSSIATINDGNDGERGTDGDDGFSPVATVSKSGDTATISITDKNGTTTTTVTDGDDAMQGMLFFGQVDSTSTSTAFTAQIDGITEYYDGLTIMLKNGVVTSASGFTIDINGLGAKHAYSNMALAAEESTLFNINFTMMFTYDSTRVEGGGWILYRGYNSDNNTIGYQLRTNSMSLPMTSVVYRYRLLFTSADKQHFVPANNSTSTNATSSRTVCQDPIDPFGEIVYCGTTSSVAAGSRPSATTLWRQYAVALGYSFNRTGAALTMTLWKPVYVKCAPQSDGSAIIDSTTPFVQTLPSTEDGKIYIFLGVAYSATNIELVPHHPVYEYKKGAIRLYGQGGGDVSFGGATAIGTNGQQVDFDANNTTFSFYDVGAIEDLKTALNAVLAAKVGTDTTVNGHALSSDVALTASDVNALPASTVIPTVSVTQKTSSGTNIADITINGTTTQLYAPSSGGGLVTDVTVDGTSVVSGGVASIDLTGKADASDIPTKVSDLTNDAGYISSYTETDPTVPAWAKASTKPTYTASEVGALPDTTSIPSKTSDLTNDSGFITGMEILSYGSSTWNDFITAYNAKKVVYCRASSNSNPASGSQTRLAFMAYVNNASTPTEVEFQYYRSIGTHSASQQGDQVFVYKLTSGGTWTVTTREATTKIVASTGLQQSYSNGTLTVSLGASIPSKTSDLTNDSGFISSESDPTVPSWAKASSKPTYTASEVGALPDTTVIPSKVSDLTNDSGFISSETDPIFTASDAYGIASTDIANWDNAYDGNISFDTSASSGDDYDLRTVLTSLGWLNDVIV